QRRALDACWNGLHLPDHADGLYSEPGWRIYFRRHAGRPGHLVRVDGGTAEKTRRYRAFGFECRRRCGVLAGKQPGIHLRDDERVPGEPSDRGTDDSVAATETRACDR